MAAIVVTSRCPECGRDDDKPKCPKCGAHLTFGYGLCGGGVGPYTICCADACDYFDKQQDPIEGE